MYTTDNILLFLTPKASVSFLTSDMTVRQGIEKFKAHGYSAVPIIDEEDGTYCGVINEGDFLKKIISKDRYSIYELEDENIMNIIRRPFPAATVMCSLEQMIDLLLNQNFVPIVDDRNVFMGIVTRKSIISYLKDHQN